LFRARAGRIASVRRSTTLPEPSRGAAPVHPHDKSRRNARHRQHVGELRRAAEAVSTLPVRSGVGALNDHTGPRTNSGCQRRSSGQNRDSSAISSPAQDQPTHRPLRSSKPSRFEPYESPRRSRRARSLARSPGRIRGNRVPYERWWPKTVFCSAGRRTHLPSWTVLPPESLHEHECGVASGDLVSAATRRCVPPRCRRHRTSVAGIRTASTGSAPRLECPSRRAVASCSHPTVCYEVPIRGGRNQCFSALAGLDPGTRPRRRRGR